MRSSRPLRHGSALACLLISSPAPSPQAEAIGARYAANWSAKHTTAAVSAAGGKAKANGGAAAGAAANPLLAGTKFDPFAANGTEVGTRGGLAVVHARSVQGVRPSLTPTCPPLPRCAGGGAGQQPGGAGPDPGAQVLCTRQQR